MTSQTKQCTTVQKNEFEQLCELCLFFYYTKLVIAVQNFLV